MMDTRHTAGRLRQARLAAGLQLSDIEQRTRISPVMLRRIDDGEFDKLPAGIYARAYVRAYAGAVGLDPDEVVSSIEHELPPAADLAVLQDAPPAPARPLEGVLGRLRVLTDLAGKKAGWGSLSRVAAAAALDGVALTLLYFAVLVSTAAICSVPLAEVAALAMPWAAALILLLTTLYFAVFAGIGGQTPAARLLGLPPRSLAGPLRLSMIARRSLDVFLIEASLAVDLLVQTRARRRITGAASHGSSSTL